MCKVSPTENLLNIALVRNINGKDVGIRIIDLVKDGYKTYSQIEEMCDDKFIELSKKFEKIDTL